MTYRTSAGSGVPNVGAPDCIEIELAKIPSTTGAPGRVELHERHPGQGTPPASGRRAAAVTGDIAPARMNGVISVAWLPSA